MKRMSLFLISVGLLAAFACAQYAPVAIEGMYPDSGPPGTSVVLKGHGFANGDRNMFWSMGMKGRRPPGTVMFNGVRAQIRLWQDDLIVVVVPPQATSGFVQVVLRSGITAKGNHFEITDADGVSVPRREGGGHDDE